MKYNSVLLHILLRCLFTVMIASVIISLPGCNKEDRLPDTVSKADSAIALSFPNSSIPLTLVDSAYIVLLKKGSGTPYFLRFHKTSTEMVADIDGFKGEYAADLIIHTRVTGSSRRKEYHRKMTITIGNNNGKIMVEAPGTEPGGDWKSRIILSYDSELSFYISLDQSDPYFRVEVKDRDKWKMLQVVRSANNKIPGMGTELVSTDRWACENNCFTNFNSVENTNAFLEHANRLRNKTWNFGEIEITAETKSGIKTEDYFFYSK